MGRTSLFKPKASGGGVLSTGDNIQGVGVGVFTNRYRTILSFKEKYERD